MLTDESIEKLRNLIDAHGGAEKEEILEALDDVARLVVSQSLLIRNMGIELTNQAVSSAAMNGLVTANSLSNALSGFSPPKRNAFSVQDARNASQALVAQAQSAGNFAEIFKTVVSVAKVFI